MAFYEEDIPAISCKYIHQVSNIAIPLYAPTTQCIPPPTPSSILPARKVTKYIKGSGQCSITCLSMLINAFLRKKEKPELVKEDVYRLFKYDDILYKDSVFIDSPTCKYDNFGYYGGFIKKEFLHQNLVTNTNQFGSNPLVHKYEVTHNYSKLSPTKGYMDIKDALYLHESPVIIATKLSSVGHFILIIGYNKETDSFIVHDPYWKFDFKKGKHIVNESGESVEYPFIDLTNYMRKWSLGHNSNYNWLYIKDWETYNYKITL